MTNPSPFTGEGGARPRSGWEGEGLQPSRKELLARAKWMRANPTEAEKRLWSMLRDRRFAHCKFRRQQVIDWYIVDFVSLSERLIVEADGSQHADSDDDLRRDSYLRGEGFRVLRFWNNQIHGEPDAVKSAIFAAVRFPHAPKPSAWAQSWGEQRPALFRSCWGHDHTTRLSPEMGEGSGVLNG